MAAASKTRLADRDEFRPLTTDEKQQFVSTLNGEGRRMLAELAGETNASIDPEHDELFFFGP
jgi:hypothetical protein